MKKTRVISLLILNFIVSVHIHSQTSSGKYTKVFIIGNSLTHGFGTHGMASTDINSDYYYWVQQALYTENSDLLMNRFGCGPWESGNSDERLNFLNNTVSSQISGEEDLIIIQVGDNVNTNERRESLKEDAVTLINWFNTKCPHAKIIWVYGWYGISLNMPLIKQAIFETGVCQLVDISEYSTDSKYKSAIGNKYINANGEIDTITSAGVASHPGDLGMKVIADEILQTLNLNGSNNDDSKTIVSKEIFDLNGNIIKKIQKNQVCIIKENYSDGSTHIYKVSSISTK